MQSTAKNALRLESTMASQRSIRATFAIVTCHFLGSDLADPNSSLCHGYGDVPESVATQVAQMGHDLINHSVNHIPLDHHSGPRAKIPANEATRHSQKVLDRLQDNTPGGWCCVGLAWQRVQSTSRRRSQCGSIHPEKLTGPIDADVGGAFLFNGKWIGGDWDCFSLKIPVHTCGDLYVNAIRAASTGVVVLLHVRTESMNGRDGNPYALALTNYIVEHLGTSGWITPSRWDPGRARAADPILAPVKRVSTEFGPGDGQGDLVAGAIAGSGKPSRVRASVKRVTGPSGARPRTAREASCSATHWLSIQDQTWFLNYGSKFWLADLNGDGRADLVFPHRQPAVCGL